MKPHVILLSVDSLRGDFLEGGPFWQSRDLRLKIPELYSFSRGMSRFTQARSTTSYTTTAHAGVLTGLYPPQHGLRAFYHHSLDRRVATLAEMLRAQGYETILSTDTPELFVPNGLSRGFEKVFSRDDHKLWGYLHRVSQDKPVFLLAHFYDVHQPYGYSEYPIVPEANDWFFNAMEQLHQDLGTSYGAFKESSPYHMFYSLPYDVETSIRLYARGIEQFDRYRFAWWRGQIDRRFPAEDSYVFLFGDHGQAIYPKFFGHGAELLDGVLHIPLWVRGPEFSPGELHHPVTSADITPTLVRLLDIPLDHAGGFNGRHLLEASPRPLYSEYWKSQVHTDTRDGLPPIRQDDSGEFLVPSDLETKNCIGQRRVDAPDGTALVENEPDLADLAPESPRDGVERIIRGLDGTFEDGESFLKTAQQVEHLGWQTVVLEKLSQHKPQDYYRFNDEPADGTHPLFDLARQLHAGSFARQTPVLPLSEELQGKLRRARQTVEAALKRFTPHLAVAFTGGKDSLVALHLFHQSGFRGPVINIDTTVEFPEIYAYRDHLVELWGLDLHVFTNHEALNEIVVAQDKEHCCHLLKTVPLQQAIRELGLQAVATGVRRDESPARAQETSFSPRPDHMRVHPIVEFTEQDVWTYIAHQGLPYCPLYDKGYRSLGCLPCTQKATGPAERSGRAQDKEQIMQRLREHGYF